MSRGPDAGTLLRRALERHARERGCVMTSCSTESTRWASATFIGARHRLSLEADDDAVLAAWLGGLEEADLPIRGHLVADLVIASLRRTAGRVTATLEALTVES